jgi:hypothetical protein
MERYQERKHSKEANKSYSGLKKNLLYFQQSEAYKQESTIYEQHSCKEGKLDYKDAYGSTLFGLLSGS